MDKKIPKQILLRDFSCYSLFPLLFFFNFLSPYAAPATNKKPVPPSIGTGVGGGGGAVGTPLVVVLLPEKVSLNGLSLLK